MLYMVENYNSNRSIWDEFLLENYPELRRLIAYLNYLRSIPADRRGRLVNNTLDVLEKTRVSFLRALDKDQADYE